MGSGFCFFADIPLAVYKLWEEDKNIKALIIDLDAYQGNGCEDIFKNDKRIFILDVYNSEIYPCDYEAEQYIDYNFPIKSSISEHKYLQIIEEAVTASIKESKADLIIYNAGTDIFQEDALGCLSISKEGIIKRDEIVFKNAIEHSTPILMVLSGGYHKKSWNIIAVSVENIINLKLKR